MKLRKYVKVNIPPRNFAPSSNSKVCFKVKLTHPEYFPPTTPTSRHLVGSSFGSVLIILETYSSPSYLLSRCTHFTFTVSASWDEVSTVVAKNLLFTTLEYHKYDLNENSQL